MNVCRCYYYLEGGHFARRLSLCSAGVHGVSSEVHMCWQRAYEVLLSCRVSCLLCFCRRSRLESTMMRMPVGLSRQD